MSNQEQRRELVIIVDDNPLNQQAISMGVEHLLGNMIRDVQFEVRTVSSAAEALAILSQVQAEMSQHEEILAPGVFAIFTDLQMPGMDGYELLAQIEEMDPTLDQLVGLIVIVSSYADVDGDEEILTKVREQTTSFAKKADQGEVKVMAKLINYAYLRAIFREYWQKRQIA